jgi:hypothetical protein
MVMTRAHDSDISRPYLRPVYAMATSRCTNRFLLGAQHTAAWGRNRDREYRFVGLLIDHCRGRVCPIESAKKALVGSLLRFSGMLQRA